VEGSGVEVRRRAMAERFKWVWGDWIRPFEETVTGARQRTQRLVWKARERLAGRWRRAARLALPWAWRGLDCAGPACR
jgi:hypothetical protein